MKNKSVPFFPFFFLTIIKKRLELEQSLYTILQILSITLFEKTLLAQAFAQGNYIKEDNVNYNQLYLLD